MRCKIAIFIINVGIQLLPKEFRNRTFIRNCMATQIIKVNINKEQTECEGE